MVKIEDYIVGQERGVRILKRLVKKTDIPNILIYGPPGVGKRRAAIVLASCITGTEISSIKKGKFVNIRFIVPGSRGEWKYIKNMLDIDKPFDENEFRGVIRIEYIRDVLEDITLYPVNTGKRVVLIMYADRLTPEATSSLLKTLEEPPDDTVFILTTSRLYRLPKTIISRCEKVQFGALSKESIRSIMRNLGYGEDDIRKVIGFSEGSLKNAIRFMDREKEDFYIKAFSLFKEAPFTWDGIMKHYFSLRDVVRSFDIASFLDVLVLMYRGLLLYKEGYREFPEDVVRIFEYKDSLVLKREVVKVLKKLLEIRAIVDLNPTKKLFIFKILKMLI